MPMLTVRYHYDIPTSTAQPYGFKCFPASVTQGIREGFLSGSSNHRLRAPAIMFTRKEPKQHLLALPAELRERIFVFAVTASQPVVTFRLDSYQKDSYEEARQPALTHVSRQVRREALPLYFECNEIVLHTDGAKSSDAQCWLALSASWHLRMLSHLVFWVRYIPASGEDAARSGALGVAMRHDKRTNLWRVDEDWRWITVVRKPADLRNDGTMLASSLQDLTAGMSRETMSVNDYETLIASLRQRYWKTKVG